MHSAEAKPNPWLAILIFGLLFSLSLLFRVWKIENIPGVSGDEAFGSILIRQLQTGSPTVLLTPTGRLLSPLYTGLVMITDGLLRPSFFALRLPALVAGVFAVFLTFWLFLKPLGSYWATLLALVVAVNPVNIAYSRLGIEQSLMLPAGILFVFFCWTRHGWGIFFSLVAALLVHPINIFLTPLVLAAVGGDLSRKRGFLLVGALTLVVLEAKILPSQYSAFLQPGLLLARFTTPGDFAFFGVSFVRLVTGVTALQQFAGLPEGAVLWSLDLVGGIGFATLLVFGVRRMFREKDRRGLWFFSGWVLHVLGYYLVTGKDAIDPGVSRYALVLLFPTLFFLVLCDRALTLRWRWLSLYGAVSLAIFYVGYFQTIEERNSTSFRAYYTAEKDPKLVAADFIKWDVGRRRIESPITIIAEDWWSYWPLRYLFFGQPGINLLLYQENVKGTEALKGLLDQGAYAIGFVQDGAFGKDLLQIFSPSELEWFRAPGYGGAPVLHVWRKKTA